MATRATSVVLAPLIATLVLTGCQDPASRPLYLSMVEIDGATLTVHPGSPCPDVTSIVWELTRDVTDGPDETLGTLRLSGDRPVEVDTFTYGDVPAGFRVEQRTRTDWRDADYVRLSVVSDGDERGRSLDVPGVVAQLREHPGEWYLGDSVAVTGEEGNDWVDPDDYPGLIDPDEGRRTMCG